MSNIIIPSDPNAKDAIRSAIKELDASMIRVKAERDLQKDILQNIQDKVDVPKKYIKKMATIYHKQNLQEVKAENDDLETLYEAVNP